jgi:hypothetical protein
MYTGHPPSANTKVMGLNAKINLKEICRRDVLSAIVITKKVIQSTKNPQFSWQ